MLCSSQVSRRKQPQSLEPQLQSQVNIAEEMQGTGAVQSLPGKYFLRAAAEQHPSPCAQRCFGCTSTPGRMANCLDRLHANCWERFFFPKRAAAFLLPQLFLFLWQFQLYTENPDQLQTLRHCFRTGPVRRNEAADGDLLVL